MFTILKGTWAISRLAGFSLRWITNTQVDVSNARAHPQSGSRPTGGGALSPLRPGSPACCGIRLKLKKENGLSPCNTFIAFSATLLHSTEQQYAKLLMFPSTVSMQLRKVKYHKMQFDSFTIWQNVHHFEKAPGQSVVSQASDSVESPTHRLLSPLQARILNLDPDPQEAEHWAVSYTHLTLPTKA